MIRGCHAALDPDAVGAGHIVVVQVLLTSSTEQDLRRFNEAVRRIPRDRVPPDDRRRPDYLLQGAHARHQYRRVMGADLRPAVASSRPIPPW